MSPSNAIGKRFLGDNKEWKSTALSLSLPPAPPLCDSNTTSHHVSVDSDDSVVSINWNIQSDSSLVPSSDSSIQSELSLAFDNLENREGFDETISNNNNNVTLIRHVNVALKHDDVQEILRADPLVHRTRTRMNLSSPQHVDLIQSVDVYDTNQMLCRSTTTVCLAKAGPEHVYIMGGSGGSNILKVDLTSRCGDKKVIWLERGRGGRGTDDEGNNKRMVRAMAVVDGNMVVTSEQCARGNRHEIRVWRWRCRPDREKRENVSKKTCNNHYYYYYTCVGTLPDRYSWARIRQSLVASNYVRIRRHHTRLWTDHVDAITCLAFCQSNHVLYSVSWDRTLKVWRLSDLRCLQSVARAHDDAINACIVCHRSAALFTAGADATVKLWLPASASASASASSCDNNNNNNNKTLNFRVELVATLAGHKSAVNALALSADGRLLYSGSADRTVQVWAIKQKNGDGRPVATLVGHGGAVLCLSATATDVLCSGSADKTVRVWRRWPEGTWDCVAVLRGHAAPVKSIMVIMNMSMSMNMAMAMATAGCHLPLSLSLSVVSASSDGHVRLWSLK